MNHPDPLGARFGWLASYPKSGNTWLRMMLRSLAQGGGPVDINESGDATILNRVEFDQHFGIESSDLTQAEIDAARPALHRALAGASGVALILRKVHDCCWRTACGERVFPPELSRGAVYIVRDPRDVAVSYAHHCGMDLEASVRCLGDPAETMARSSRRLNSQLAQPLGTWSEHVASWLDDSAMPVLLLRYEDMLADAAGELGRVARFLGLPEAEDPRACAGAAAAADFSNLRRQEEERGFREKPALAARFFRQGRAGEGREVLPPHLLRRVEGEHGAMMERLGYGLS